MDDKPEGFHATAVDLLSRSIHSFSTFEGVKGLEGSEEKRFSKKIICDRSSTSGNEDVTPEGSLASVEGSTSKGA